MRVAPKALDAGALATAFCVMTPEQSRQLAKSVAGVEYLLAAANGARYTSAGWNGLVETRVAPMRRAAAGDASLWIAVMS